MTSKSLHLALAAVVVTATLAGCNRDADRTDAGELPPPTATTPAPAPTLPPTTTTPDTAVNVTSVTLGTEAGADRSITNPTTSFGPDDPIVVSVRTDGAASNVELGARLLYQDGQVAGEERQGLNTTGAETTNITFNNANAWPAGTYTVEVMIDGVQADSTSFTVE